MGAGAGESEEFDGDRDWWIAFQLRYYIPLGEAEEGRLELALYFETLPYYSQAALLRHVGSSAALDGYRQRRGRFCCSVANALDPTAWSIRGNWCQVAKCRLSWDQTASRQSVVEDLAAVIRRASSAVELALADSKPSS
jgi:hypothetical protein